MPLAQEDTSMTLLEKFMTNLYRAGFDVQTILARGLEYSLAMAEEQGHVGRTRQMVIASHVTLTVAETLGIDRESQFRESRDAWKQEMVDRALRLGLTIGGNADAS